MAKVKSEAVFTVKINMDNDEIELLEENAQDDSDHMVDCNIKTENTNSVKLIIMEDAKEDAREEEDEEEVEEEENENDNEDHVNEVIEHVCGKCYRTYSNLNRLKKHLKHCKTQTRMDTTEEQNEFIRKMERNITTIEEEAEKMESQHICFCCEENLETCHSGHIRCYECTKSFKNSNSFNRHVFLIHSCNENYRCKTCNARCPTKQILELHEKSHNRGKPFACKKCGKEFTRRYHLFRHQKYSACDKSTRKPEILCKVCGKVFYRIDNLRNHLRQHLGEARKSRDYQCPLCDKSFYGTATLNIHIRSHTGERPFPCDLCDKSFPSNAALRKHRRSHTGEKPYTCKVCRKSFAAKEVLNRHMKTHTGERPHSCETCGKSFIQATQLKNHNLTHHTKDPIKCTMCENEFTSQQKLQKHMKTTHSIVREINVCPTCNEGFLTAAGLKRHISRMHKVVQFNCTVCDEIFTSKKDLNFHSLLHDDENETIPNKSKTRAAKSSAVPKTDSLTESNSESFTISNSEPFTVSKNEPFTITECIESTNLELIKEEEPCSKVEIEEYILEEISSVKNENENISDSEDSDHTLMEIIDEEDELVMDETTLKNNVEKLLDILLDKEVLIKFGWPTADVDYVLHEVIKNCGHTPVGFDNINDYATRMREYVKLLFTVVIDNDSIKELLNNHSIDEVINQVLAMAQV